MLRRVPARRNPASTPAAASITRCAASRLVERREHAAPGARHPRVRSACAKPLQVLADRGKPRDDHRLQVVAEALASSAQNPAGRAEKSSILRASVFRVNSGAAKTAGVGHRPRGHQDHVPARGQFERPRAARRCPRPRPLRPKTKKGTSAPSAGAELGQRLAVRSRCPRGGSAREHGGRIGASAAQARRPSGCAFPPRCRRRAACRSLPCSRRAARTARSCVGGTPGTSFTRAIAPSSRTRKRTRVAAVDEREDALQQVVAVRAPADDVQEEVQLRGRGIVGRRERAWHSAPSGAVFVDHEAHDHVAARAR